jgi:hypothetical protein
VNGFDPTTIDTIATAVAKKLDEHDTQRRADEEEAKQKEKKKEQLTGRISIAAMALTILMSFLGYVRAERDDAANAAKGDATQAQAQAEAAWTYYQAKNEQRASIRLADDELTRGVQGLPPGDPRVAVATAHHLHYMNQIFEVSNQCRHLFTTIQERNRRQILKRREAARIARHTDQYEMGTRILTLAVIVFSITLLTNKSALFWAGVAMAFVGAAVAMNGYFLFFA